MGKAPRPTGISTLRRVCNNTNLETRRSVLIPVGRGAFPMIIIVNGRDSRGLFMENAHYNFWPETHFLLNSPYFFM